MNGSNVNGYFTRQIESRSVDSGRRIRRAAQRLRTLANQLRQAPSTAGAANFADRGAGAVDRVGPYLERANLEQMIADAERFGRRKPLALATAGIAVGMLAARLLKSTAARRWKH
jgi:hypothetical protein